MSSNTKQPTPAGNGKHIGRPSEQDPGYSARSKQMSQVRQELFRHEIKVSKARTILRADPNWVQRCRLRLQKRPDLPRRIVDFHGPQRCDKWSRRKLPFDRLGIMEIAKGSKLKPRSRKPSCIKDC